LPAIASISLISSFKSTHHTTHLVKYILQLVLGQGAALDVADGAELLGHLLTVLLPHGAHLLLAQLLPHAGVVPQIRLRAHDQARHAGAVVMHLREPLFPHVLEAGGRGDAEADEEHVRLGVRERPQPVVILLSGRVEEPERVWLVTDPKRERLGLELIISYTCTYIAGGQRWYGGGA
jgi:hypothetical protein